MANLNSYIRWLIIFISVKKVSFWTNQQESFQKFSKYKETHSLPEIKWSNKPETGDSP